MEQFYYLGTLQPNETKLDKYQELIQYAERLDLIAVDTETFTKTDRTCIGVGIAVSPNDIFYFPTYPEISSFLPTWLLSRSDIVKIFHNAPFDLDVLDLLSIDVGEQFDSYNVRDTAVAARLLLKPDASLEWLAVDVGMQYHETAAQLMEEYGVKSMADVAESAVALHCCKDARLTYLLWQRYKEELDMPYFITEMAIIPILQRMSKRGLKLDKEYRDRLEEKLTRDVNVYREIADGYGFNPGSGQQAGFVIAKRGTFLPFTKQKGRRYDDQGNKIKKRLSLSTSKETLEFVDDPLAAVVMNYRSVKSHLGTYVKPLVGEDRVYTHFHLDAVTGRISSGSGKEGKDDKDKGWSVYRNLQNIPPGEIRNMILPDTGHFTDADWSQMQLRILTYFSQDPEMLWIYDPIREGTVEGDIHQATADFMHIPRKGTGSSKNVNFCVPTTTKALTPYGWKTHEDLSVGELVLGYSQETKSLLWTEVSYIMNPVKSEVWDFGNAHTQFTSTPSHRWFGVRRVKNHKNEVRYVDEVRTLDNINSEFTLTLSAYMDSVQINHVPLSAITEQEASILAWLVCDGTLNNEKADIYQTKPDNQIKIRQLLIGIPHIEHPPRWDGLIRWHISQQWVHDIDRRLGVLSLPLEQIVIRMSPKSRLAFIKSSLDAEGSYQYSHNFRQNVGPVLDAMRTASFLEGYFTKTVNHSSEKYPKGRTLRLLKPYMTSHKLQIFDKRIDDVWCMQTGIGSWIAKDSRDQIFITGNAMIFGATPQTIRETAKIKDITVCEALMKSWAEKYPVAWSWIAEQQATGLRQGYVTTLYGRKIRIPNDEDEDAQKRKSVNYPIMGTEAEIIKRAMLKCSELDLALQVHDEIIIDGLTILPEGLDHISDIYTPFAVKVLERWE